MSTCSGAAGTGAEISCAGTDAGGDGRSWKYMACWTGRAVVFSFSGRGKGGGASRGPLGLLGRGGMPWIFGGSAVWLSSLDAGTR